MLKFSFLLCLVSLMIYLKKIEVTIMAKKFTEIHDIPYYECDTTGTLRIPTLLKMVIKTSASQSDSLGVSNEFVATFGLTWIIIQHDMVITRLPKIGERVSVTTEAESYNKYFCYRRFWVHDEAGNECASIESTFSLMDMKERKMGSVKEDVIAPFESEKIKKIKRNEKIMPVTDNRLHTQYAVRFLDIDRNKHVNNSVYLEWMMDVLGYDYLVSHTPKKISIKFNKEVRYGNDVSSIWQFDDDMSGLSKHTIQSNGDNCAEANILWEE